MSGLKDRLEEIGLTDKESLVYLQLLKFGPQAVSVIAKCAGLNRSTTYSILKSLEQKALIAYCNIGKVKFFSAQDPNALIGYLDRQCRTFDYYRSQLLAFIPKIRSLSINSNFQKPTVSYFEGKEGIKHVLFESLKSKTLIRNYFSISKWLDSGLKDFIYDFTSELVDNKKVLIKQIIPNSKSVKNFLNLNSNKKNLELLCLDLYDEDFFKNEICIYDNTVIIIDINLGCEFAIEIKNDGVADFYKNLFDMAWNHFAR